MGERLTAECGTNGRGNFRDLDANADGFKEASPTLFHFRRVGDATEKPVAIFRDAGGLVTAVGSLTVRTPIHQASIDEKLDLVVLLVPPIESTDDKNPSVFLIGSLLQQPKHHLAVTHQRVLRYESEKR